MPRATTCTFSSCSQGLVGRVDVSKSQRNYLLSYYMDTPVTFICPYTGRLSTFRQQGARDMDYVSLCGNVFTLNTNFRRHYESFQVAADTARSSSDYAELAMNVDNNISSSSSAQVAPSGVVCEPTSQPLGQAHTSDSAYKPTRQSARLFKIQMAIQLPQRNSRSSTTSKVLDAPPPKQARSTGALAIPLKSPSGASSNSRKSILVVLSAISALNCRAISCTIFNPHRYTQSNINGPYWSPSFISAITQQRHNRPQPNSISNC